MDQETENRMMREVVSVEYNKEWFHVFSHFGRKNNGHTLIHGDYDDVFKNNFGMNTWGVVFIDNSPGGERRARNFQRYIDVAHFVVVHDFEKENEEMIRPMLFGVRAFVTTRYTPPTLIASLNKRIPDCVTDL